MTDLLLPPDDAATAPTAPRPMIVADNAHVNYRVYASGKRFNPREKMLSLSTFRGGRELQTVPALRGVSFTASEGETIGVIGHNGSGKSTLFRAMSGLIPTAEGTIWAAARPVLLGVNAALVPELSGENNIKLGLLAMGFTPEEAAAHVDQIADFAELNEYIHHPMRTYSSGMSARLRFAIASARAHSILLIDEALSVGDRRFKLKSEERIRGLRDSAGLVMIVSHSAGSLKDTCERVLWIHKGELRADGPAIDVIDDYVKWTKQPGGAVGAAPASKSPGKARREDPRAVTRGPAAPKDHPVDAVDPLGFSAIERLLADAEAAGAKRDADDAAVLATRSQRAATTGPVPTDIARTIARRERFRRTERERRRRRIILIATMGVAVVLAVGAGAAIAILAAAADTGTGLRVGSSQSGAATGDPAISAFSAATPAVQCATADGSVDVALSWSVDNAAWVSLGAGAEKTDAIDNPLQSGLPDNTDAHIVAYSCADESRIYTLTAASGDGSRASATVVVTRTLAPTPEATESAGDDSDSVRNDGSTNTGGTDGGSTDTGGSTDPGTTEPGTTDPGTTPAPEVTPAPVEPTTPPVEPTTPPEEPTVPEAPPVVETPPAAEVTTP